MSKYTTEVRYICESYAGLTESVGYDSIDEIVDKAYDKIFKTQQIPMFAGETSEHRALLYKKILLHYYTREIGYESVGLWKLKLNQKMMEIMPYYNKLYESELLQFNPLENVNVTKTHEGEYNDDEKVDNERNTENHKGIHTTHDIDTTINKDVSEADTKQVAETQGSDTTESVTLRHSKTTTQGNDVRTNDVVEKGDSWTLFSDTPQGGLDGIENASGNLSGNGYLTNATRNITTPDEQSITQTHGNIVETYNADGDKIDLTTGHASVTTNQTTNDAKAISDDTTKDETHVIDTTENDYAKAVDDNTKNNKGTDEYENKDIGKIGTGTYSRMLDEWRETFLNIDLMVIRELEPLFIGLW